jgi:hypothetical protein
LSDDEKSRIQGRIDILNGEKQVQEEIITNARAEIGMKYPGIRLFSKKNWYSTEPF